MKLSMKEYEVRTNEDGEEVVCSTCGSRSATVETEQAGRLWYLCPFCYETNLGIAQIYKRNDAEQAKQLAQAMNVLLSQLKTPNANTRGEPQFVSILKQRAELCAALEGVLPFLTGNYWPGEEADAAVDRAVAIIRKAEAGGW